MGTQVQLNHIYRRRESRGVDGERYTPGSPAQSTIEVKTGTIDIYTSNAPAIEFKNPILGFKDKHPQPPFDDADITTEMQREPEGPLGPGIHTICSKTTWIAFVPAAGTPEPPVVCEACIIDHQFEIEANLKPDINCNLI